MDTPPVDISPWKPAPFDLGGETVFAIGDVHGCARELAALLDAIAGAGATAAETQVAALHTLKDPALAGDDAWTVGGRYEFTLTRIDGAWRIDGVRLIAARQSGNPELMAIAQARAARG